MGSVSSQQLCQVEEEEEGMEERSAEQLFPLWMIEEEEVNGEDDEEECDREANEEKEWNGVGVAKEKEELSSQVEQLEEEKKELLEKQQNLEAKAKEMERENKKLEKQQQSLEKKLKLSEERRSQLEELFLELKNKKNAVLKRSKMESVSKRKKKRRGSGSQRR